MSAKDEGPSSQAEHPVSETPGPTPSTLALGEAGHGAEVGDGYRHTLPEVLSGTASGRQGLILLCPG